jgi:hypothetical protein
MYLEWNSNLGFTSRRLPTNLLPGLQIEYGFETGCIPSVPATASTRMCVLSLPECDQSPAVPILRPCMM